MSKQVHIAAVVTAVLVALGSVMPENLHAQSRDEINSDIAADTYAQSDTRDGIKQALKLTAEQEKLWLPLDEALRSLQEQRRAIRSAMTEAEPSDQMERLRRRADLTTQRATALKKVTEAVQPLWATLSEEQKYLLAQSLLPSRSDQQHRMSRSEEDDRHMRYRDRGRSSRYEDEHRWYRHRRDHDRWGWRDRRDPMMSGRDEDDDDDRDDMRGDRFERYSRRWSHDYPRERRFGRDRYDLERRSGRDYCRCDRRD